MAELEVKVGQYLMHHMHNGPTGTLVRISAKLPQGNFSIDYIPDGGGSSSWPAENFRKITDPVLLAVAKAHEARLNARDCEVKASRLHHEAAKWDGVIECLREVQSV